MCFIKELRPLANVSIFSVCHVHGHASLFLDRLGFQYKLNGDDRSVPNFCVYVICICVLCCVGRPYYKQQWGKRRQTRQRKKDMAVILNNPLSKLIISRGNHHTFLRHALNNPKCQGRCA